MRLPTSRPGRILILSTLLLSAAPCLHAAGDAVVSPPATWHPTTLLQAAGSSLLFGFIGIVLAIVGFKMFDLITPFNLEREMCENKNLAVGILCGAIVVGICHIIAASIG